MKRLNIACDGFSTPQLSIKSLFIPHAHLFVSIRNKLLTLRIERRVSDNITVNNQVGCNPITTSVYDIGDSRTEVHHPASGITSFAYDPLGNVLTKQTANMAEKGKMITYTYDYHRLTGISYPDHPENNVKYYYGSRNASYNLIKSYNYTLYKRQTSHIVVCLLFDSSFSFELFLHMLAIVTISTIV